MDVIAESGKIIVHLGAVVALLGLLYLIRIHIAYRMAKNRHRAPAGWVLLSLFFDPLLTWIILLIIGDSNKTYPASPD